MQRHGMYSGSCDDGGEAMRRILAVLLVLWAWASPVDAACSWSGNTGTVASPYAVTDVAACVTDASSKTGAVIIQIPNSSATWASTLTVNMQSGFTNVTSLTIRGQNDCTMATTTDMVPSAMNFTYPTACGTTINNMALSYTGKEGKAFRFAHFTITGTVGFVVDGGDGKSLRIDHNYWNGATANNGTNLIRYFNLSGMSLLIEGVIDHNHFAPAQTGYNEVWFTQTYGNATWVAPFDLGGDSAMYIESNKITYQDNSYFSDNNGGDRRVVRFNHVTNGILSGHDLEMPWAGFRGSRKMEVYGNYWDSTEEIFDWGGNGVIFNNTLVKAMDWVDVRFHIFRLQPVTGALPTCATTSGENILTNVNDYPREGDPTTKIYNCTIGVGGCARMDGTTASPTGYPCRDQWGVDSEGIAGNENPTAAGKPFYIWGNTRQGGAITVSVDADSQAYMVENRDWYRSPATTGGGAQTTGVGSGTKATMNALNCTTGVAFWVTDEGSWNTAVAAGTSGLLYRCTATNTWTLYYTPLTYPHPYTVAPSAPTNVRIR